MKVHLATELEGVVKNLQDGQEKIVSRDSDPLKKEM